jgi:hypothetical protein
MPRNSFTSRSSSLANQTISVFLANPFNLVTNAFLSAETSILGLNHFHIYTYSFEGVGNVPVT